VKRQARLTRYLAGAWVVFVAAILSYSLQPSMSGFSAAITNDTNTAASATWFTCQNAYSFWAPTNLLFGYALTDAATATSATDFSGNNPANKFRGTNATTAGATSCPRDASANAYTLNGTNAYLANTASVAGPSTYAIMVWFKTSTGKGEIAGYGNNNNGNSTSHDKQVYLTTTGQVRFYVNPTAGAQYAASSSAYNDGNWHFVVAQQSATIGMQLYIDGALVGSNAATTSQVYNGNWRFGGDVISNLVGGTGGNFLAGQLRYAGVLNTTLNTTQIAAIYRSGLGA
jgi:Concanavalin A-like lectin/glucanases superfamily